MGGEGVKKGGMERGVGMEMGGLREWYLIILHLWGGGRGGEEGGGRR